MFNDEPRVMFDLVDFVVAPSNLYNILRSMSRCVTLNIAMFMLPPGQSMVLDFGLE